MPSSDLCSLSSHSKRIKDIGDPNTPLYQFSLHLNGVIKPGAMDKPWAARSSGHGTNAVGQKRAAMRHRESRSILFCCDLMAKMHKMLQSIGWEPTMQARTYINHILRYIEHITGYCSLLWPVSHSTNICLTETTLPFHRFHWGDIFHWGVFQMFRKDSNSQSQLVTSQRQEITVWWSSLPRCSWSSFYLLWQLNKGHQCSWRHSQHIGAYSVEPTKNFKALQEWEIWWANSHHSFLSITCSNFCWPIYEQYRVALNSQFTANLSWKLNGKQAR